MSELVQTQIVNESLFLSNDLTKYKHKITDEIIYGMELRFNYINADKLVSLLDSKGIEKENLTCMDVLKYNFEIIISQLSIYFPNIKFDKTDNAPCINECENFNFESTYKYSIYLVLSKDDKTYEYGFDFLSNLNDVEPNKYEDSKFLLDNKIIFKSFILK